MVMFRARLIAGLAGAVALASSLCASAGGSAPSWGFFEQYCTECHNATDWAGSLAFDTLDQSVAPNAEVMEKVVRKMRGQLMPPGGHTQPAPADARAFIKWVEGDLDVAGAAAMLSKPSRMSSRGNSEEGSMLTPSRSRTAFAYSLRFRRCSGT